MKLLSYMSVHAACVYVECDGLDRDTFWLETFMLYFVSGHFCDFLISLPADFCCVVHKMIFIWRRTLALTRLRCRSASTTPSGSPCSSQQSVYHPGNGDPQATATPAAPVSQPGWNPFGDDNFSRLTAEELLNKDFAKLAESECSSVGTACGLENSCVL